MLHPSELFAITWEEVLFPGDLRLLPYVSATAGFLICNAKTAQHIAQKQLVTIECPAEITLLMDLRAHSSSAISVFHFLSYSSYRTAFKSALQHFELPVTKITFHGARGGAAFLAHKKGQKADQTALVDGWRSTASVAHYLDQAKAILADLRLGKQTHTKTRTVESAFFDYLTARKNAVETHYTTMSSPSSTPSSPQPSSHHTDSSHSPVPTSTPLPTPISLISSTIGSPQQRTPQPHTFRAY